MKTARMTTFVILEIAFILSAVVNAQPVHFDDPQLKAAVEAWLGVTDPNPAQMLNLTQLDAPGQDITDLTGLEYALNLWYLRLYNNQVSDLSPLAGLTKLRMLFLDENQVSNVSPLAGLTNLESLDLIYNQVSDISPLVGLTKLFSLNLGYNPLNTDACTIYIPQIESHGTYVYHTSCWTIVPVVVGMMESQADSTIVSARLVVGTKTWQCDSNMPSGGVIDQSPAGGMSVYVGSAVNLTISTGPCLITVPNVVGMTESAAGTTITSARLVVGTKSWQYSNTVPAGSVISQNPTAGSSVPVGSAVNLTLSSGPALVTVPNVVGMTESAAGTTITSAGLVVGTKWWQCSDSVAAGKVISQNPAGGTSSPAGSTVNLTLSTGPCQTTVPDVAGMTESAAATAITSANLQVGIESWRYTNTVPYGIVINQRPAAGASVSVDSEVHVVLSNGPCDGHPVSAPKVVGQTLADAQSTIASAGLTVGTIIEAPGSIASLGRVLHQQPEAGTLVDGCSYVHLVVSFGPDAAPADPNLLTWWGFDESSENILYDSAGLNDGVTYGDPVWQFTGGRLGGALRLDGIDDYVQLPIGPMIGSLTDSTFAIWVNWSGVGDGSRVFEFGSGEDVSMSLTPRTGPGGAMRFTLTAGSSSAEDRLTARAPLPIGWHHVAVTIDQASTISRLYLDGRAQAIKRSARFTPSSLGNTTHNWLGRSHSPNDHYFSGRLDDFRIYNRALTVREIHEVMNDLASSLPAIPISVTNYSFEQPGIGKIKGWDGEGMDGTPEVDIPGWCSDSAAVDSGVMTGLTPTDGLWAAFLTSSDPGIWQLTNHTISTGEVFTLAVDARISNGTGVVLLMVLYYDEAGARIPAAAQAVVLTAGMHEYDLSLDAADMPAAVGKKLGIEFANVTPSGKSWLGLDHVRLNLLLTSVPGGCSDGDCPSDPGTCTDGDCPSDPGTCTDGDCPTDPGCTDGDCPTDPGCSDGDCPTDPGCSDGDCPTDPGCTDGDCPTDPGCSDGDCPTDPGCSDGDCPTDPGCTNGDCPTDPGCSDGDCPTDPGCSDGDCPTDPGCTDGDCPQEFDARLPAAYWDSGYLWA